ncbi:F5/8 type C domain protein [Planctomycetes bacterium CA13]|uniref:F5/8 type C domain protein n=1 Tax=Novipirellula herctigrandis TaxID=2527986 RepID=A0A5C5Z349_9BACT|nr:F5/8 type C domain protein [Planctomycetes bacterium CA13]
MNRIFGGLFVLLVGALVCIPDQASAADPSVGTEVEILVSSTATSPEQVAANELVSFLTKLYPDSRFEIRSDASNTSSFTIKLGTPESAPGLVEQVGREKVQHPESYVVTTDGENTGIILGADPRGVMYGVYGILEKLGCGFYLTSDALPETSLGDFSLHEWSIADRPLVSKRYVFNWHNFLSGCTGWNYEDWESWIVQSQKMGFNTIMVHAYGNNPMFTYTFNGITKEVGYYGSSRKGRDWGRQHINDVRRIPGGDIFDGPEFGSDAALVSDEQRIEAAQSMMKRVFECAERRGMDICFAIDIDTTSVLLQDMIETLPSSAKFSNGRKWLPKPDSTDGRAFYQAQVESLLTLYPEIDDVALWRRSHAAEWGALTKREQLPVEWQAEYNKIIARKPEAADYYQSVCSFAINKVVTAYRESLDAMGRTDVRLSTGSWNTEYIPALVTFLPEDVTIMPLDSNCMPRYRAGFFFEVPKSYADLEVASGRVMPIIWAHHDDGEYIGRPMKSQQNFCDTLETLQARGYGIIHWMKRPLDLHFRNHEKQVWATTRNESCQETCRRAALHWFGEVNQETMSAYLYDWWTQAPIFGRVTGDQFFKTREYIPEPKEAVQGCRRRLDLLSGVDLSKMPPEGRHRVEYFKELEATIISFCEVQEFAFRPAVKAIEKGDYATAQRLLKSADPRETMRAFSRLSQLDGGDRTEEAMVLSLGTRWLTDYIAACQKVGLESLRINFGPTHHETLAQSGGKHTFFVDPDGDYWSVRGERETNGTIVSCDHEVAGSVRDAGYVIEKPVTIPLSAIVPVGGLFRPGQYEASLWLDGPGEGEASLIESGSSTSPVISFAPVHASHLRLSCKGNSQNAWNSIHRVRIETLSDAAPEQVVKASASERGYPATAVLDGNPNTRWATEGEAWIQFRLDREKETDSIEVEWYGAESRKANYSVEVSDDGKNWRHVELRELPMLSPSIVPFAIQEGSDRELKILGSLSKPGQLSLSLNVKKGKPILSGVVVHRVEEHSIEDDQSANLQPVHVTE